MNGTGIYFRVQREGHWVNLDLVDLTANELDALMAGRGEGELRGWILTLARLLREWSAESDPEGA